MVIIVPLLVALVGLVLFLLFKNGEMRQLSFVLFQVGVFWTVYQLMGQTVSLLK